ncbi:MAG: GLUG motif-containing protein [Planctomycetota bacterium]|jgi:hypothetical protein
MNNRKNLKPWVVMAVFLPAVVILSANAFATGTYDDGDGSAGDPFQINTPAQMDEIGQHPEDWDKCFILTADIDMSGYSYTTALIAPDTNSIADGFQGTSFTGVFDGNDFSILNLLISGDCYLGLFGRIVSVGEVKNLGIENINITGGNGFGYLGGLCGVNSGTISDCYATGSVTGGNGSEYLGGLCGRNSGTISDCYATGSLTGGASSVFLGGLCGVNVGTISTISNCYATGSLTGGDVSSFLGGLCGVNDNHGTISNCYATGSLTGGAGAWGFGGLCGSNKFFGTISNSYATGSVTTDWRLGGLIGENDGTLSNCYATGSVTGMGDYGGLVGWEMDINPISNCFWDKETSGLIWSQGGTGRTTVQMQTISTFTNAGWDFAKEAGNGADDYWTICDGQDYPRLKWQFLPPDFDICVEGVDWKDFAYFANFWLDQPCEAANDYCYTADLDSKGSVDANDLAIISDFWLEGL